MNGPERAGRVAVWAAPRRCVFRLFPWSERMPPRARPPKIRERFAYVDGVLDDDDVLRLCRLRYGGSAASWGFAIYLASKDGYERSVLPTGSFTGTPEEALDCACELYLNDPGAWHLGHEQG